VGYACFVAYALSSQERSGTEVRAEPEQLSIGERVALYRRRRGMPQAVLAGLVGRTESWVSQVERGALPLDRLSVIEDLARALKVKPSELLGQPFLMHPSDGGDRPGILAVRDALMSYNGISTILHPTAEGTEPPDLVVLRREVDALWQAFQASRYSKLGAMLPQVLSAAQLAVRELTGDDRRVACELLAETYHATNGAMTKLGEVELAWVAADRSIVAADQAENPLLVAASARLLAHALLAMGNAKKAQELTTAAVALLEPRLDRASPAHLSVYGALFQKGAIAAARRDDPATARDLLAEAERAADLLGEDRNELWTAFGPTNVQIHRVSAAVELGDGGRAVELARAVTPARLARLPVLERRAHFLVDLARAYGQWGKDAEAEQALLDAEQLAPEEVHYQPLVRELTRDLLRRERRAVRPRLRRLAARLGVLAE
jgi:transcriptional regulator with XRE-family HTH domain